VQPAALERLFHLTPAEARLASFLANGVSVEDAAAQLGVTRNTVRTQLQAVFAKTRTNRQGDLIRLILSTTAVD
jgi:DNA-binding CsgD family transcriptional regulator